MEIKPSGVLVTGGAGFIGHHLSEKLVEMGRDVFVIDDLSTGSLKNISHLKKCRNFHFVKGTVLDRKKLAELVEKVDQVFHLAAKALVEEAYLNPLEAIETNVMGTVNVLEACRKKGGIKSIVVTSSDKAYGKAEKLPYNEEDILRGGHPYDASKSSADLIARAYFKTYQLPVAVARFSNVFGGGDRNFSRIVPGTFEAIIKNKELLIRSDGKMIREYTYIEDVVDGFIKLAENIDNIKGEAFNFGSKNIFSVIDLVQRVGEIFGTKVNYRILNAANNEIPEQYLDWTKAKNILNWQPKTSFEEGIKESLDWYKNYFQNP